MATRSRADIAASEMSVRELDEETGRDLAEQFAAIAEQQHAAAAQEAVAVNRNPLTPQEDVEQAYEWRAIPIVDDAKVIADEMRNITEVRFFEYASTTGDLITGVAASKRGMAHLYRRRKRREYQEETDTLATLLFQHKMLMVKKEVDQTQVAVAEHRRANPSMGW